MDYLTIKEFSELSGYSERHSRRICQNGTINSTSEINSSNGRISYMIPISALSDDLQAKYYAKLKADAGLAPELKDNKTALKQRSKGILKPLEQYSETERDEIAFWSRIIREWHENRDSYKSKTQYDADFCSNCRLQYGEDFSISPDILYRKYEAYTAHDYDTLDKQAWRLEQRDKQYQD